VLFLVEALKAFVLAHNAGKVLMTGLRVKLWDGTIREPDVVFMSAEHYVRREEYWLGADLVMEVVSPGGRERDLVEKRYQYAKAGISEYWIVDPRKKQITVLKLQGERYVEHGIFKSGSVASSALLKGLSVDVAAVFAAAE
jgi:Uma2 family endonuclease